MAVSLPKNSGGSGSGSGASVQDIFNCEANLTVGDFVYPSEDGLNFVLKVVDNESPYAAIGICLEKRSPTEAVIHLLGRIKFLGANFVLGRSVAIGFDGRPTSTFPQGLRQDVGWAVANDEIIFQPQRIRNKRFTL